MPNYWTRYAQLTLKLEKAFEPKLVKLIKQFRSQFISDLQNHGESYARSQLSKVHIDTPLTPMLQTVYKTAGLMGAKMTYHEIKSMAKEGVKAGGFGRNEQWVRDVLDYLKTHLLGFVQDITDTMRNDIIKTLQKAVDQGWSIAETVKELQDEGMIQARATVIARTEINRAANVGHTVAAKSLPYEVDKKWISAQDHRTRESHLITNGHTTGENDFFTVPVFEGKTQVGTDEMSFPGDPHAHASNTINCRCRVIFIPKRDSQGKLIMRQPNQALIVPMRQPTRYTPEQIAAQLKAHTTITVK